MMTPQEKAGVQPGTNMFRFLQVVGEVCGLSVLDAGCGEGYLSRILARHGAKVTGIDISPRLVEIARTKELADQISYEVMDLSQPLPAYTNHFDLVTGFFVLNDVYEYRGFLATLGSVLKRTGRLVLFMNNPYSFVVRGHTTDYFASGAFSYRGMADAGVNVHFYQRTLEEYLEATVSLDRISLDGFVQFRAGGSQQGDDLLVQRFQTSDVPGAARPRPKEISPWSLPPVPARSRSRLQHITAAVPVSPGAAPRCPHARHPAAPAQPLPASGAPGLLSSRLR
jgi:SAM-dependent methyltransferase